MKNVVITGASGLVATELILLLLRHKEYNLFLISTSVDKIVKRYAGNKQILCMSIDEFEQFMNTGNIDMDCILHAGFARSSDGTQIANSLCFTRKILNLARKFTVPFINISSQSVYGQRYKPFWTEDLEVSPDGVYALGKYSAELLTEGILDGFVNYTNLRLSSVCENARFMNVFVKRVLAGEDIEVFCGSQTCSFIDVRDVAVALKRVIDNVDMMRFQNVYNLGTGTKHSILEIADRVKNEAISRGFKINVICSPADYNQDVGMDNGLFCTTFEWKPIYGIKEQISALFDYNCKKKGGYPKSWDIVYIGCYK